MDLQFFRVKKYQMPTAVIPPGCGPMIVILKTKDQYEVGSKISVKYHPTLFSRVYIEGMSEPGMGDVKTGVMFILPGAVPAAPGILLEKLRR